jgi:hypothetical protein
LEDIMYTQKIRVSFVVVAVTVAATLGLLAACSGPATLPETTSGHSGMQMEAPASQGEQSALYGAMRTLCADHMQWTYATVADFFHDQDALQPTLDRLLQNQVALGDAIVPFYGADAGSTLTGLLTEHIQLAVPVLTAAQAGDDAALTSALDDWYANAQAIADFLSAANPTAWPSSATSAMMKGHIDTTVAYSVDLLKGDYAQSITDYDAAFEHMMQMADTLAAGIIAQFPDKF